MLLARVAAIEALRACNKNSEAFGRDRKKK
jgi:hypothetical protein